MREVNGYFFRFGGVIGSHDVEINEGQDDQGGDVISLKDIDDNLIGRILAYPPENPACLIFDTDENPENGNELTIIPRQGLDESGPYDMTVNFSPDPNNTSFINIDIRLEQTMQGRKIPVQIHSCVALRNVSETL